MLDVTKLMKDLARDRPVFHSEADFQHALAWHIHAMGLDAGVRLEYRPDQTERIYLDLWLSSSKVAVELKYLTRKLEYERGGECYALRTQGAQDTRRYDFLKDIQRLEQLSQSKRTDVRVGFAILLTNDPLFWKPPRKNRVTFDAEFRLHERRTIARGETMGWSKKARPGTTAGRREAIRLNGTYVLRWQDYADVGDGDNGQFRYLAVQVDSPSTHEELREFC